MFKLLTSNYLGYRNLDDLLDAVVAQTDVVFNSRIKLDESEQNYTLSLDLPGYKSTDVDTTIENKVLTIKANNSRKGKTEKVLILWDGIDYDKVSGKMEDGILLITLPKIEKAKAKKVKVE
jgi:HSP20 family protein